MGPISRPGDNGSKRWRLVVRYIEEDHEKEVTVRETLTLAYLTLLVDDRYSHSFPLKGEVRLGRDKTNAVVASDQKVSRHHATLTPKEETYILTDQGSANGTYVNGVRISQPTRLKDKDRLTIGDTTFLFTTHPPETQAGPTPSAPAAAAHDPLPALDSHNRPIWMIIGCMAVVIILLLVVVALLLGIFVGRGQTATLSLWWLSSIIASFSFV